MTPQKGYVQGQYMMKTFNLPIYLVDLLDQSVKKADKALNETVARAICKEILKVPFEEVNAKNGELYPDPKRVEVFTE